MAVLRRDAYELQAEARDHVEEPVKMGLILDDPRDDRRSSLCFHLHVLERRGIARSEFAFYNKSVADIIHARHVDKRGTQPGAISRVSPG